MIHFDNLQLALRRELDASADRHMAIAYVAARERYRLIRTHRGDARRAAAAARQVLVASFGEECDGVVFLDVGQDHEDELADAIDWVVRRSRTTMGAAGSADDRS